MVLGLGMTAPAATLRTMLASGTQRVPSAELTHFFKNLLTRLS
jgi:hypothetical protein